MNDKIKKFIIGGIYIAVVVIMIVAIIMMFKQFFDSGLYITFEKS